MNRGTPPPDEYRLTRDEVEEQVRSHQGFIHLIAGRWRRANPRLPLEEYVSAVQVGFWWAQRLFDKRRGLKFTTYARCWADNEVRRLLLFHDDHVGPQDRRTRLRRRNVRVHSLSSVLPGHDDTTLEDLVSTIPQTDPEERPPEDLWSRVRAVLDERSYRVLTMQYVEGLSYAQIGDRLGLTRERVRQLAQAALERVRRRAGLDF